MALNSVAARRYLPVAGLAIGLALFLFAALSLVSVLRGIGRSADLVARTYQAIGAADAVLATLTDAETGQRGFLLTGEARYLDPYRAALTRLDQQIAVLGELVGGETLDRIRALAAAKTEELGHTIARAEAGDREGALKIVRSGGGQATMQRLREAIGALVASEEQRLRGNRATLEAMQARGLRLALLDFVLSALSGAIAAGLLWRRGRMAEASLIASNAALQARMAQIQAIYDGAPVGLAFVTPDLRIAAINRRLADIGGRPVAAYLGRTLREAIPEAAAFVEPLHQRALAGDAVTDVPVRVPVGAQDGAPRDYVASYWPVRAEDGRVMGVHVSVMDVTDIREAERQLRELAGSLEAQVAARTTELSRVNSQLEAFAYTVSHDLRAPLRAMEGFARILLEDYAGPLGEAGARYARRVVGAAERMDRLIQDLLTFSRLQRAEIAARPIDPTPIAQQLAEAARAGAPPGKLEIAVAAPLPPVMVDPVVLSQVLGNLIDNAAKFRNSARAAHVRVAAERRGDTVRLIVADDGIGIAPEHQERIFNVFERLHGQETYPGTGIGLAIVKTGVERMGGRCGVSSVLGRGSCFWVDLPAAPPGG